MDVYRRPKGVAQQPREQPAGRKLPTKCGQCETEEAKLVSKYQMMNLLDQCSCF